MNFTLIKLQQYLLEHLLLYATQTSKYKKHCENNSTRKKN